ncbi:triose-phosphate isomerase [Candidatus Berkelbacteria bacterium]|nr:triose-phosphate isomerase [Candidatus Berkelbacteria bacterium]
MAEMKKLVIGNWKMNPSLEEARKIAGKLHERLAKEKNLPEVIICPPLPWLIPVKESFSNHILLGAQNAVPGKFGAETGSVSVGMLKPYIQYLIIGHSERRLSGRETHETIALKVRDALKQGVTPVVCVGEFVPLYDKHRRRGRPTRKEAESNIFMQLRRALKNVPLTDFSKLVLAYEPVWAIGTGESASAEYVLQMVKRLRKTLSRLGGRRRATRVRILYGGSVDAKNAADYATTPGVDGVLVGTASLKAPEFMKIVSAFA